MKFRCSTNPNFSLRKSGVSIQFKNGKYETDDAREINLLKRSPHVEEDTRRRKSATSPPRVKREVEPTTSEAKADEDDGAGEVEGPSFA